AALTELAAIEREVTALGHVPLEAKRALVTARLGMDRMDLPLARRVLSVALAQALSFESDVISAEAAERALFVEAMLVGPDDRDPDDEAVARALVTRVGAPAELAALLDNNVGVVQAMSGQREQAARAFARALARADEGAETSAIDPVD